MSKSDYVNFMVWHRGLAVPAARNLADSTIQRGRNVIEAIMWHGSSQSDARWTVDRFRNLSKSDRDAMVAFINAI
ncbi:MAG: hypothetical protein IK013_01685 [Bacteroidales bacterium]|nr:hypothetical protein [Bacteroidales bacterium]